MARVVHEIMNAELFTVSEDAHSEEVLGAILKLGITAVPVLDSEQRPLGVTSLRDLVAGVPRHPASSPARSIAMSASIEDAAHAMCENDQHHLVVVGSDGRAVGMLSSLDLLRGLIGLPAKHPSTFPHYDAELGVRWSDASVLDREHVDRAPDGGGILVLSRGGAKRTETDLWVEASDGLRARLVRLVDADDEEDPALARLLRLDDLRFRCASILDAGARDSITRRLRTRIEHVPPPGE